MDKSIKLIDPTFNLAWEKDRKYSDTYLANCKKWVDVAVQRKVLDFPIQLILETSTTCNLKCPMCMRTQLHLDRAMMTLREWCSYITEGLDFPDFESVKPNYRNEPTMNPHIADMLAYAKEQGVKELIMNTNGNFPSRLVAPLSQSLTEIAFSIDAFNEDTYNKVRTGGSFKRVQSNVLGFIRASRCNPNLRVRVAFVVQKDNAKEKDRFLNFWTGKVDKVVINECYNPGQAGEDRAMVDWVQDPHFCCPQIFQRLVITPNGEVLPCCGAYNEKLSLGNINELNQSIYDFWHGDKLTALRKMHAAGQYNEIEQCSKCALTFRPVVRKDA